MVTPPTWGWLGSDTRAPLEPGVPLPVNTNGFFPVTAITNGLSVEQTQAQIRVRVTDAAGAERAGDLRLLADEGGEYWFGWSARVPLAIGERLNAVLSADPSATGSAAVGGSFALLVTEAPVALPEPELALGDWARYYEGTGETLKCRDYSGGCGSPLFISVPGTLVEQRSAHVTWTPPATTSYLAWRLHWWAEPRAEDGARAEGTHNYWGLEQDPVPLGTTVFPDHIERHCVTLLIEDLSSGETRRAETCAEPGPLEGFRTDTRLRQCTEPPSAELTRAWCNLRSTTAPTSPLCAELPAEESAPANEAVTDPDVSDDKASGCQLGASSGQALGGAAIAAIALYTARRRRKRA